MRRFPVAALLTLILPACAAAPAEEESAASEAPLSSAPQARFAPTYRNFHEIANVGIFASGCIYMSEGPDKPIHTQSCIATHKGESWLDLGYGGDTGEAVEAYAGRAWGLRDGQRDWIQFGQQTFGKSVTPWSAGWTTANASWLDWTILGMTGSPESNANAGGAYVVRTGCTGAQWDPSNGHYWTHCDGWVELSWNHVWDSVPHKSKHSSLLSFGLTAISIVQCAIDVWSKDLVNGPSDCAAIFISP